MKKGLLLIFLLISFCAINAQNKPSWQVLLEQLSDIDGVESGMMEDAYERLSDLAEHPINLNNATREDLEQLPFLSKQQIEDMMEYIDMYAPLRSMGELAMIESLDFKHRQLLAYFVTIDKEYEKKFPTLSNICKYGRNELLLTGKIPFYQRKGDKNGYLGYPYQHWLKYQFSYGQYLKIGVVGAQDAGEPWFAGNNKWGYDYYSFYVQIQKWGRIKSLVLGRYRTKFGLGVVMNREFSFGKLATLSSLGNLTNAIRGHSSRSETNYLQGAATTIELLPGFDVTAFVSYRKRDCTLNKNNATVATIVTSGYHRTLNEMKRKHNTSEFVVGSHLQYFRNGFHVGLTAFSAIFNRALQPKTNQIYRQFSPQGKCFWNTSIDYGYISRKLNVQGEMATSNNGAMATVNAINYLCKPNWSVTAVQRFYSYKYYSLFGRSFSDGGHCQNESGIYVGTNYQPSRHLSIMAYADWAYFPWATYRASQSSYSADYLLMATYQQKKYNILARYRLRMKQKDNTDKTTLVNTYTHRARLSASVEKSNWFVKTQVDGSYYQAISKSVGWMITQNIGYCITRLKMFTTASYFNANDFNSRLYTYERGMLYTFSFPMFVGKGTRYAFNIRYDVNQQLMLAAKAGMTLYFDREKIGSSYQQINGNKQTDMEVQIKWKF